MRRIHCLSIVFVAIFVVACGSVDDSTENEAVVTSSGVAVSLANTVSGPATINSAVPTPTQTASLDTSRVDASTIVTTITKASTLAITKLELAQTHVIPAAGKTWDLPLLKGQKLHLVADRETLVLVDLSSSDGKIEQPTIEAQLGGKVIGTVALNSPASLYPTESGGPSYSGTAFWAKLNRAWIKPGLSLAVRANTGQVSISEPVSVGAPNSFTMYKLPFYLFGLDETAIPLSTTAAPDKTTRDEYFAKHPFSDLNMVNHAFEKVQWPYILVGPREGRAAQKVSYKEQQGDSYAVMSAVLDVLKAIRGANGDVATNNQYYAPLLMANQAGVYSGPGGGFGGSQTGTGNHDYTGIFIHEAGHAFGMPHANDGYASGTYPYVGGSLQGSSWGFDAMRNEFLGPFVPSSASRFKTCKNDIFPMGRQLDSAGRCVKQDPMQSGAGDQSLVSKFNMFSDYNASVVQRFFEGTTSLVNSKKSYSGGKLVVDSASPSGYSRWDSLESAMVSADIATYEGAVYSFDQGTPIQRSVPVYSIVFTASVASVVELNDPTKLSYADTVTYSQDLTQIYPVLSGVGHLMRLIDPSKPAELALITPKTGQYYSYCRNSGCDYSLRITFADASVQMIVVQKGFRSWFNDAIPATINDANSTNGFRTRAVNVSSAKAISKIELLETPEVWKGLPISPKVIATREVK